MREMLLNHFYVASQLHFCLLPYTDIDLHCHELFLRGLPHMELEGTPRDVAVMR